MTNVFQLFQPLPMMVKVYIFQHSQPNFQKSLHFQLFQPCWSLLVTVVSFAMKLQSTPVSHSQLDHPGIQNRIDQKETLETQKSYLNN